MSAAVDMFGGPELYQLQQQIADMQRELETARENARFEHKRWFDELQRNDELVNRNEHLRIEVEGLRAQILDARRRGRTPVALWLTMGEVEA